MQKELLYSPVYVAPTQEELRSMLGGAYAGCKAIRDFAQANYKVEERWRYSDKRDAFDCLMYDGDKRLCSLHLRSGRLSLLVMFSQGEQVAVDARLSRAAPRRARLLRGREGRRRRALGARAAGGQRLAGGHLLPHPPQGGTDGNGEYLKRKHFGDDGK